MRENIHRLGVGFGGIESPEWGAPWDGLRREEVNHRGDVV